METIYIKALITMWCTLIVTPLPHTHTYTPDQSVYHSPTQVWPPFSTNLEEENTPFSTAIADFEAQESSVSLSKTRFYVT